MCDHARVTRCDTGGAQFVALFSDSEAGIFDQQVTTTATATARCVMGGW